MSYEFGLIGCGNMGSALAEAVSKTIPGEQMLLSNRSAEKARVLADRLSAATGSNEEVAREARYIFLGVKPAGMQELLSLLYPVLSARSDRFVLVSMAAGLSLAQLRGMAGADFPMIRIMPNTPVSVGQGVIVFAASDNVTAEEKDEFTELLSAAGILDELPEELINAECALAGCGPAFADLFMEALADAGVEIGLPRDKAIRYASQMLLGSAELQLRTGKHPGVLKDEVCSPGGSTIVGVHALESGSFRAAVMNAVTASFEKSVAMGKAAEPQPLPMPIPAPAAPTARPEQNSREQGFLKGLFSGK